MQNHIVIIISTYYLQTLMKHFLRSVARLFTASSLCLLPLASTAQEVDRFYLIDKSTLETYINTSAVELGIPILIVAQADGMAMTSALSNNYTSLSAHPVSPYDRYAETEYNNIALDMYLEYIGRSSKTDGYEFYILNNHDDKYLGTASDKFSLTDKNANAILTFIFDKEDETKFQIQTKYYKNNTYHSIIYTGPDDNQGFKLADDDSKIFSLYHLDYLGMTLAETPIDDSGENITVTLNPHALLGRPALFINYIINNGEEVTLDDLLASEHRIEVSWAGYSSGPLDLKLPNYDSEATTLWAVPTIPFAPQAPYGPLFTDMYADLSTGITAPAVCDKDETPVYYTIQGIRVSQPSAPGIYLCRRGADVSKILLR